MKISPIYDSPECRQRLWWWLKTTTEKNLKRLSWHTLILYTARVVSSQCPEDTAVQLVLIWIQISSYKNLPCSWELTWTRILVSRLQWIFLAKNMVLTSLLQGKTGQASLVWLNSMKMSADLPSTSWCAVNGQNFSVFGELYLLKDPLSVKLYVHVYVNKDAKRN